MINEIIYKKIGEWEVKGSRQKLLDHLLSWLNQFDEKEQLEMLTLLSHFDYYSSNKLPEKVKELYKKFLKICSSKDIVFCKTEKTVGTSFSNLFFDCFWDVNNLYDFTQDNLSNIIQEIDCPQNIVLVDDYFGSGKTITSYLKKLLQLSPNFTEKNIYFLALHGSNIGEKYINDFANQCGLKLKVITLKSSSKAFDKDNIYKNLDADIHRKTYSSIYDKHAIKNLLKFGYCEIEALVSFYYNTPNNTLGIFWQNLIGFKSLFKRHDKSPTTLRSMQIKSQQNKQLAQNKPFIKDVESYKKDIFMVYCISKSEPFDVQEACKDFGLTEYQLDTLLKSLTQEGYLYCKLGRYHPTDKLKKCLYTSKIKEFRKKYYEKPKSDIIRSKDISYIPKNFKEKFKGYSNKED